MSDAPELPNWSVADWADHLAQGRVGLSEAAQGLIDYTLAAEPQVQALAHFDPDVIRLQAEHLLAHRGRQEADLPLWGVPVAVKDTLDTLDYPTEWGWAGAAGRSPHHDAWAVHRLRQAGALVWAKTRCTELGLMTPGPCTNPRAPGRTPGGSSSGSAAAVAAGLVPAALGTQANGSIIRPASYCGVVGYKPSRGLISNAGVLEMAPSLEQVGVLARTVLDCARVAQVLMGGHPGPDGRAVAPRNLVRVATQEPPFAPKLMGVHTPWWPQVEPGAQQAFDALLDELRDVLVCVELPDTVRHAQDWLHCIFRAEAAQHLQPLSQRAPLSVATQSLAAAGAEIRAVDYLQARARMDRAAAGFDEYFEHFDAIVAPATLGPARLGLEHTGDPIMSTLWTFAGLPCLSLPLLQTEDGLPLGVQLIGAPGEDARLLRTAHWLTQRLGAVV